jgi:hypothetical protein
VSDPRPGRREPTGYTPAGFRSEDPATHRPSRPVAVELATATVIVTGVVSVLQSVEVYARLAQTGDPGAEIAALSIPIGIASVVIGLLLRTGRAWLVGVNLLAIAGFLELLAATPLGILAGIVDMLVVVTLVVNRPWFAWRPAPGDDEARQDGSAR